MPSALSAIQPRWPRTRPPRTWKTCTATSSGSSTSATTSVSVPSPSTTAFLASAFSSATRSSRIFAACSYSSFAAAARISRSSILVYDAVWPLRNATKSSTISRCCSGVTSPVHGAEHLPMYPSRQGRPICRCRLNTPLLQDRIGNTRSSRSTVSRIAHAWLYGPKYFTPFFFAPRPTITRGISSSIVIASHGYDLSSRYFTLNRGSNSLIQEYSSCSASTSLPTTVQSTFAAVFTIPWVRGCRFARSWKYDDSRARRFFALPT